VAAVAGASRETVWIPVASDDLRWNGTLERLRAADTTTADTPIVHAPVRVLPLAGKPAYLQAAFRWRAGGVPSLARIATVVGDTVRAGPSLAAALGFSPDTSGALAATPADLRTRTAALYGEMRDALRRGDWTAFGRAFEALGAALRAPQR
jgi:uncharacterized membrane protein (UPF0182 family)